MKFIENPTIISGLAWHNHHHMILIFISLATPKQALTTSALKTILRSWSKYGMICINPGTAIGASELQHAGVPPRQR